MSIEARMAVEALRAGVPNRAAIRQMGTEQTGIENAFETALGGAWPAAGHPRVAGIGMAGGFGAGKSHLLGYLAEVARQQGFVVSRVVISKETPLSHPAHVLAAALRHASLPDRPDDTIAACIAVLRERPDALDKLEAEIRAPDAGFAPVYAACLYLLRRGATSPETVRRIARLWGGAKVSMPDIRSALADAGAGRMFSLKAVQAAAATTQLIRFLPLLFRAAGYAGWCILFDEIELIGRYTPLQRAQSYAWLGTWLGLDPGRRFHGIAAAYAITDDFVAAVITAREDADKVPERLALKGRGADADLARLAIRHIERTVLQQRLLPPSLDELSACHNKVLRLYRAAYDWMAPPLPPPERTSSRTMRQYIKGWITQWDMLRLDRGAVLLLDDAIPVNYAEDALLAEPPGLDDEET